jgi:hypothetical protein
MMGTTEPSSRFPPNLTTSVPQRQEEHTPAYNTRGSSWGSSRPVDPSRKTGYGAFPPTRQPQHGAQYSYPSQVQGSLGSQRQGNAWDGESSHPSGDRDSGSNPSADATGSHSWSGQPASALPGWSAHAPHRVLFSSISASKFLTTIHSGIDRRSAHESNPSPSTTFLPCFTFFLTSLLKSYPFSQQTSPHDSADGEGDKSPSIWPCLWLKISLSEPRSFTTTNPHPGIQRRLTVGIFLSVIPTSR